MDLNCSGFVSSSYLAPMPAGVLRNRPGISTILKSCFFGRKMVFLTAFSRPAVRGIDDECCANIGGENETVGAFVGRLDRELQQKTCRVLNFAKFWNFRAIRFSVFLKVSFEIWLFYFSDILPICHFLPTHSFMFTLWRQVNCAI